MENNSFYLDLLGLLSKKAGVDKYLINESTTIEEELGLTGDDALELIHEFSKKFNVDISGFVFSKYFHPEPHMFTVYGSIILLTVGDLYRAIFYW